MKDPDILRWDLDALKSEIEKMEIYIPDKGLNVVFSSIEKEVGLNFDSMTQFKELLKMRLDDAIYQAKQNQIRYKIYEDIKQTI